MMRTPMTTPWAMARPPTGRARHGPGGVIDHSQASAPHKGGAADRGRRSLNRIARIAVTAASAAAAGLIALAAPAAAATQNISFFTGGNGSAHWAGPSHSTVALNVPDNGSYAGFNVHRFPAHLPAERPSFSYTETGSPSGGAPRLVFEMSNGDTVIEYAATPVADGTTVNTAGQFDVYGGPSGYQYNEPYGSVTSEEAAKTVTAVFLVSDSYTGAHAETVTSVDDGGVQLVG